MVAIEIILLIMVSVQISLGNGPTVQILRIHNETVGGTYCSYGTVQKETRRRAEPQSKIWANVRVAK